MRMLRASRSPAALRCRYMRSSSAVSGFGKEPPPEMRRDVSILLSISHTAAESISFHLQRKPMSDRQVQIPVYKK